jgi:hypothetical protein
LYFRIFSYRRDVIAVLAVKAKPLRGRFASLDGVDGPTSTASKCQNVAAGAPQEGDRP